MSAPTPLLDDTILAATGLTKSFTRGGFLQGGLLSRTQARPALLDVSLVLRRGDVLGIVGESGSGKSTLARCLTGLERPDAGAVVLDGQDLSRLTGRALRRQRRRIQIVFQDPFASLNPRLSVRAAISEVLRVHELVPRAGVDVRVAELLDMVGLRRQAADRYPADFSGGQRQRICLARALAAEPDVLIADEAVSSLDVSIQAQVLNLLVDLRRDLGLAMIFISHDLHVVQHVAPEVAIMFGGRIVEKLPRDFLFEGARHPYTLMLLAAMPRLEDGQLPAVSDFDLSGALPREGCPFRERCSEAFALCEIDDPRLEPTADGHLVACHYVHSSPESDTDAS
jgi:oligopeptide transport system ATP-binding protein